MSKYLSILLLAGISSVALVTVAQQPAAKLKNVPIKPTSPASGSQMYASYCAACHGGNAKGTGPAVSALKLPPADLTLLSQKNGGKFPAAHVQSVLRFGVENPAHGSEDMPIWGDLMTSLDTGSRNSDSVVTQRITNLVDYIKSIQK
jgi:mono/diheme cytochrome c family protein